MPDDAYPDTLLPVACPRCDGTTIADIRARAPDAIHEATVSCAGDSHHDDGTECGWAIEWPPDPLGPDAVFCGDRVYVITDTDAIDWSPMPATHPEAASWHVSGRVYGDPRITLCDRMHEYSLEWEPRFDRWRFKANRRAYLYPHLQDECSPADWAIEDLTLRQVRGIARAVSQALYEERVSDT